jgi:hypothetical protein
MHLRDGRRRAVGADADGHVGGANVREHAQRQPRARARAPAVGDDRVGALRSTRVSAAR